MTAIVDARLDARTPPSTTGPRTAPTISEDLDKFAPVVQAATATAVHHTLHAYAILGPQDRLVTGPGSQLANAVIDTAGGRVVIGEGAVLRTGVRIVTATPRPTLTGPARAASLSSENQDVLVGAGAWIGDHSVVVGPCTIGDHAYVAPGSVVSGDVVGGEIVAGTPTRPIARIDARPAVPSVDVLTDVGPLFAHAEDQVITQLLLRHGGMPDVDLTMLRRLSLPGATVVDVGANIGYSTLALAAAVGPDGRVIAFEPHPANVELLRANLFRNGADNVDVIPQAAVGEASIVTLAESDRNAGDHRVRLDAPEAHSVVADGSPRNAIPVEGTTIDAQLEDTDVAFMILDTQGTEHHALAGAAHVLELNHPEMLVEFWPHGIEDQGDSPLAVLDWYVSLGYRWSVLEDPSLDGLSHSEAVERIDARPGPDRGFVTLHLTWAS